MTGAEALDTKRRLKKLGTRPEWSFKDPESKPFPFEAPFHPAEVAHEVFQAWLTFAIFEIARRAHRGTEPAAYRRELGELLAPFSSVAAKNPNAWFPVERTIDELITPTADNRLVGYPYTKYMISVMDVDMAAALVIASHRPPTSWVYRRTSGSTCVAGVTRPIRSTSLSIGRCGDHPRWRPSAGRRSPVPVSGSTTSPISISTAALPAQWGSPLDALGLAADDPRGFTVTGGLPFAGGAGSDYMTHSIATMATTLRDDPGSLGLVSGVGMHMTKHVYGVYSTTPGSRCRRPMPLRFRRNSTRLPSARDSRHLRGPSGHRRLQRGSWARRRARLGGRGVRHRRR